MTFRCLLALLVGALALPAAAVEVAPVAVPAPSSLWDEAYLDQQAGLLEADLKARQAAKSLGAAALDPGATAGMDAYDVTFYDLVLDIDDVARQVTGTTTVQARVVDGPLATMDLHLSPVLTVLEARAGGQVLGTSRTDEVLTLVLDRPYLQDETVSVEVDYEGDPSTGTHGSFGWSSANGNPLIWTLSEPYGARDWWACKDLTTDKADSVDLHVTVQDPLIVASNGTLVSQLPVGGGRTTFHWQERYPICTYLVSLAIHEYVVLHDNYVGLLGQNMALEHYVVPAYQPDAEVGYAVTPAMISAFAAAFGEYPFLDEKYGHAHFPWGGGMEHQTCTSMLYWYYGEGIIAHELAHQWFGDMITCADFHHIWLNEGFARWCEAYWQEVKSGPQAYRDLMYSRQYLGAGTVYVEDTVNDNIFSTELTYNKASWVVHMLRFVLGDADFFAGLALYRDQFAYGAATTEDLQAAMEAVSGRDLTTFFQQWIYGEFFPEYRVSWAVSPVSDQVTVRVDQTQAGNLFEMPLEIRVVTDQETVTHRVDNATATAWYTFPFVGNVFDVALDPDGWVLCTKTSGGVSAARSPAATRILGNAPNPFNPRTEIAFTVAEPGPVELAVFDLAGRRVRTIAVDARQAGPQRAVWDGRADDGRAVAAGVYFARLRAHGVESLHKLSLVK